ncbi:arylsulfatase [Leucobacter sp.]
MSRTQARGYEGFRGVATERSSTSEPWYPEPRRAAPGAPNVVVMLVDDLGFSDLGPFGGEIDTPHIDAVAERGWVFTGYHTAPLCSPARASLLTGLNPHRAGFGMVAHVDPGYPGYTCRLPDESATLAESLRAAGYATFMVGKWHLTPESRMHDGADRSSWPLQRGFDRYYGSMDGFTTQYHPHRLVRDNSVLPVLEFDDDYFLTDDLTEQALAMIDELRVNDRDRPFFLYYAHTAVHGPVQAKPADIAKYRDRYAAGWDVLRAERFARQQRLGIVAPQAALPDDDRAGAGRIPAWDDLDPDEQRLFARHMEVYAASVDEVDQSLGRLVDRLDRLGELDNTIIVVASDNGGTAEGGLTGTRSYFSQFVGGVPLPDDWVRDVPRPLDLIGGPRVHGHYPAGWARVSNTPFRSFKGSVYEGGVHAPLILSWPAAPPEYAEPGRLDRFAFVSDVAPTVLDLAGVAPLAERAGRPTLAVDGASLGPSLRDPDAAVRDRQYFECAGARALIAGEWKALVPAGSAVRSDPRDEPWELYRLSEDPTETRDLAHAEPERVRRLAEAWRAEAWRNTVFPVADDGSLFSNRPETELPLSEPVDLVPFRPPLERFRASRLTVLRSFSIEIEVRLEESARGVVVAHGDQGGGYLLALEHEGLLVAYNAYGRMHRVRAPHPGTGAHRLRLRFDEVEGLRWRIRLTVADGAGAELEPVPMLLGMAPFTGISVGYDYGGPVDWDLHEAHRGFRFAGGEILRLRYVPGARSAVDSTVIRSIGAAVAVAAE